MWNERALCSIAHTGITGQLIRIVNHNYTVFCLWTTHIYPGVVKRFFWILAYRWTPVGEPTKRPFSIFKLQGGSPDFERIYGVRYWLDAKWIVEGAALQLQKVQSRLSWCYSCVYGSKRECNFWCMNSILRNEFIVRAIYSLKGPLFWRCEDPLALRP